MSCSNQLALTAAVHFHFQFHSCCLSHSHVRFWALVLFQLHTYSRRVLSFPTTASHGSCRGALQPLVMISAPGLQQTLNLNLIQSPSPGVERLGQAPKGKARTKVKKMSNTTLRQRWSRRVRTFPCKCLSSVFLIHLGSHHTTPGPAA